MVEPVISRIMILQCRVVFDPVFLVDSIDVFVVSVVGAEFDKEFAIL